GGPRPGAPGRRGGEKERAGRPGKEGAKAGEEPRAAQGAERERGSASGALPTGAVLLMRIYSEAAPPGHSEVVVRGTVQRHLEAPRGVGIRFLDTGSRDAAALRGLIATLSPGFRPAPVETLAYS